MSLMPPSGAPVPESSPPDTAERQTTSWKRRDNLPLWVIVFLMLFVVERFYDAGIVSWLKHRPAAQSAAVPDTETMQDVLGTDLQAKIAYVTSFARPGSQGQADPKSLRTALKSAEDFQNDSHNSPEAARRVIILRALLKLPPLQVGTSDLDPKPVFTSVSKNKVPPKVSKSSFDPIAAFTTDLPPKTSAAEKAQNADEAALWTALFRFSTIPASHTAEYASQIRRLPNIRWWRYPALSILYQRSGDASTAEQASKTAQQQAVFTMLPASLLGLLRLGLLLLGILMLAYFVVRFVQQRKRLSPSENILPDFWPTVAPSISFADRKLGAGDLMAVFVSYLLTRDVLELLLTGFSGFGHAHRFGFVGLLAPLRPHLEHLTTNQRSLAAALLESALYLVSALPPVLYLLSMARSRKASLADEIGWNRRQFGKNVLYGLAGYAVATPLFYAAALLGPKVFRNAPAPSNPVIPEIINAPGILVPLILLLLASVAAPFVEELLFRGVFYNAAKLRLGVWPAIVLTGLVFGFIHPVGVAEMVGLATLGGVFAWMAETRKSLLPSIVAHGLNNFLTTMLLFLVLSS